ncbi:MAG: ATP-binding protein [Bacteroidia bacterium]|nr:ATP-binding protein [Bacteroidia bacterium]
MDRSLDTPQLLNDGVESHALPILSKEAKNYYQTLFENSPEGILIVDLALGRAIDINPQLPKLFQTDRESLMEGNMLVFSPPNQPDGVPSQTKLREYLNEYRAKRTTVSFEWQFLRGGHMKFDASVSISPMMMENREVSVLFIRDISQIRRAEKILEQKIVELDDKNRELERYIRSNLELENFAYIASHDLREPLRTIMGFSQLLEQRYSDILPIEAKEYLSLVIHAVDSMNEVTSDLLEYSRANSADYIRKEINPRILVENVLRMLDHQIKQEDAVIVLKCLPDLIWVSSSQLAKLFQNLISNAIKFRKKGTKPYVTIWGEESELHWKFYVQDNGIGIEPRHFEKIFLIFKRLNSKEEYKGSGIGLAISKIIVEKHGGKIGLESTPGIGTTFSFTIAKYSHTEEE